MSVGLLGGQNFGLVGNKKKNLQINVPGHYDVECIGVSSTVWRVTGYVSSDTAPAFAD